MELSFLNDSTIALAEQIRRYRQGPREFSEYQQELTLAREVIRRLYADGSIVQRFAADLATATSDVQQITLILAKYGPERPLSTHREKFRWSTRDRLRLQPVRERLRAKMVSLSMLLQLRFHPLGPRDPANPDALPVIVIIVMAPNGSDKYSFFNRVLRDSGSEPHFDFKHGLNSAATNLATSIGSPVVLLDAPRFDVTGDGRSVTPSKIADWLEETFGSPPPLLGVMFVCPITDPKLCEDGCIDLRSLVTWLKIAPSNVVLMSEGWEILQDPTTGIAREKELKRGPWEYFIGHGSMTARCLNRSSVPTALIRLVLDIRAATVSKEKLENPKPSILYEDVLRTKSIVEPMTPAGDRVDLTDPRKFLQARLVNKTHTTGKQAVRQLADVSDFVEQTGIGGELNPQFLKPWKDDGSGTKTLPREEEPDAVDLSWWSHLVITLSTVGRLKAFGITMPNLRSMLRPRLQKGYTRMEWTCCCGETLWGDYMERSSGSLDRLSAAVHGHMSKAPTPGPGVPTSDATRSSLPPASSSRSLDSTSLDRAAASSWNGVLESPISRAGPSSSAGGGRITRLQSNTPAHRWLELCIDISDDLPVLAEIDMTGIHSDSLMFMAIKQAYDTHRKVARLFGWVPCRVANGGTSVQFRKDRLADSTTGSPPTISIMQRQSMPTVDEARTYKYVFDPLPMDEPPIDSRTFQHYLQNPHCADQLAVWMNRFPLLTDSSLFYRQERLAKGWGMFITESRNWSLFVVANALALMLSFATACIYAWGAHWRDNATAVAIGAWLTTIQTLLATSLFWHWTR